MSTYGYNNTPTITSTLSITETVTPEIARIFVDAVEKLQLLRVKPSLQLQVIPALESVVAGTDSLRVSNP